MSDLIEKICDALYRNGYADRAAERDFDPRGAEEWESVHDALEAAAKEKDELRAAIIALALQQP